MNTTQTASTSRTVDLGFGLKVTVTEYGDAATAGGTGVLILHGGAGPQSVGGLAAALAEHAYVVTPIHPGFDGTPRVPWANSVADLADAYLDLLEELGMTAVMVIGNSREALPAHRAARRCAGGHRRLRRQRGQAPTPCESKFALKATVPGGWSHLRENPRAGVRRRNWLGAGGPVVVLRLPGVLVCGMMARAAHDAGASLGYEPV